MTTKTNYIGSRRNGDLPAANGGCSVISVNGDADNAPLVPGLGYHALQGWPHSIVTGYCQGRSKSRPPGRSKTRPVGAGGAGVFRGDGGWSVGLRPALAGRV